MATKAFLNHPAALLAGLIPILASVAVADLPHAGSAEAATPAAQSVSRQNMTGAYGDWLAYRVLGGGPASLSFRTGKWKSVKEWRTAACTRLIERIAPVDQGGRPQIRVDWSGEYEGLHVERLSWQLPAGPRTEAVFLKPLGVAGRLPAILALHDHGGKKFMGWRKIARIDRDTWKIAVDHQQNYYGGVAWANEIARRGYAVLVHDTFPFGSRRVMAADVPERIRQGAVDPDPADEAGVDKYNAFAAAHEHVMEKSLLCAGTTWPGVYVPEDQRALDVLAARDDVDPSRIGCAGLSGGGMRTVFLAGIDDRIRAAVAVGFMTTWRDFLLDKSFTHTWMTYVPLLPRELDFPEILALRAPAATMVLNCTEDPLYTMPEMERADRMLREIFRLAGAASMYESKFYPGGHKFDLRMQADAFDWFDRQLKH